MTKEEIKNLTTVERIAGFVAASAKLAAVGAKLRKNGRQDETWTKEEEAEWDAAADEIDPWWYSLSPVEMDSVRPIEVVFASITNGEWPPK
jgi:hypothetical protein